MRQLVLAFPGMRLMARIVRKILLLPAAIRGYIWVLAHARAMTDDLTRLHHDANVLKAEIAAMKQDLTVLRRENAELRGLGVLVPRVENQDAKIAQVEEALAAVRDDGFQLHQRSMRDIDQLKHALNRPERPLA